MKKKYLCVCAGGNVRSHSLAFILKNTYNREAIAVGHLNVSPDTMNTLCEWADVIVVLQDYMVKEIPDKFKDKLRLFDVGDDRWGVYIHPELHELAKQGAAWLYASEMEPEAPKPYKFGE